MSGSCDYDYDDRYNNRPYTGYINLNFGYIDENTAI